MGREARIKRARRTARWILREGEADPSSTVRGVADEISGRHWALVLRELRKLFVARRARLDAEEAK